MIGLPELVIVLLLAVLLTGLGNKVESALFLARTLISMLYRPSEVQELFPKIEEKDHAYHEHSS